MACSGFLAPRFVNNDYVTAEIICSTAYVCHEVLTWLWATLCGTPVPAPPIKPWELLLYHSCVRWVSQERREHSSTVMAAVSAGREVVCRYVVLCYICFCGCCASQKRINVSAVPMTPPVFFQPLSSLLAYSGFTKYCGKCEKQDNWRHKQDEEQYSKILDKWIVPESKDNAKKI